MRLIKAVVNYPTNNIILRTIDTSVEVRRQIWGCSFKDQFKESKLDKEVEAEFVDTLTKPLVDSLVGEYNRKTYTKAPLIDYHEKYIYYDSSSLEVNFSTKVIKFETICGKKFTNITLPDEFDYSNAEQYQNVAIMYCIDNKKTKKKSIILSMLFEGDGCDEQVEVDEQEKDLTPEEMTEKIRWLKINSERKIREHQPKRDETEEEAEARRKIKVDPFTTFIDYDDIKC